MSSSVRRVALLFALLLAATASAQEMELDLTDTTDYRPGLAVVGVSAAVDPAQGEKLKIDKLASTLVERARGSDHFSLVLDPAAVFEKLADGYVDALSCAELACLISIAEQLDVQQVLVGSLIDKSTLKLVHFDVFAQGKSPVTQLEVPAKSRSAMEREAVKALLGSFPARPQQLALLKVKSDTGGAVAELGPYKLGKTPLEKKVPAGKYNLRVSAEGYLADELEVELASSASKEVEANLVRKTVASEVATQTPTEPAVEEKGPSGPSIFTRPGTYLAIAGVAAAAVGLYFGSQAKGIEARARDANGDGALDITAREAATARNQALMANILVGAGAAAFATGFVWVLASPSGAPRDNGELAFGVGLRGTLP
jgi:hypothetical protein